MDGTQDDQEDPLGTRSAAATSATAARSPDRASPSADHEPARGGWGSLLQFPALCSETDGTVPAACSPTRASTASASRENSERTWRDDEETSSCQRERWTNVIETIDETSNQSVQLAFLGSSVVTGCPVIKGDLVTLRAELNHLGQPPLLTKRTRSKLRGCANAWLHSRQEEAKAMAAAHLNLAIVGTLMFSVSSSSFLATSRTWYRDAIATDDIDRYRANLYAVFMALACVCSAVGLCVAVNRAWALNSLYVKKPLMLEKLMWANSAEWVVHAEHYSIWAALVFFLLGLALFALISIDDEDTTSMFCFFLFVAGVISAIILSVVIILLYTASLVEHRARSGEQVWEFPSIEEFWMDWREKHPSMLKLSCAIVVVAIVVALVVAAVVEDYP